MSVHSPSEGWPDLHRESKDCWVPTLLNALEKSHSLFSGSLWLGRKRVSVNGTAQGWDAA